jgi:hypothetical protein
MSPEGKARVLGGTAFAGYPLARLSAPILPLLETLMSFGSTLLTVGIRRQIPSVFGTLQDG